MPTRDPQLRDPDSRRTSRQGSVSSNRPVTAVVHASVFPSDLGWMGLALCCSPTGELAISRLTFGHATASAAYASVHPPQPTSTRDAATAALAASPAPSENNRPTVEIPAAWLTDLQAFAAGTPTDLNHLPLDLSYLTDFGRRVATVCRQIPWGQTISYGELAARIGSPGAARAVGGVMARNRHPLVIPCHRVLASNGALTGFSAPQGLLMKQRLLAHEQA